MPSVLALIVFAKIVFGLGIGAVLLIRNSTTRREAVAKVLSGVLAPIVIIAAAYILGLSDRFSVPTSTSVWLFQDVDVLLPRLSNVLVSGVTIFAFLELYFWIFRNSAGHSYIACASIFIMSFTVSTFTPLAIPIFEHRLGIESTRLYAILLGETIGAILFVIRSMLSPRTYWEVVR